MGPGSRVLLTGASGFVGGHLVERLLSRGYRVRCLLRNASPTRHLPLDAIKVARGDLVSGEGLTAALEGSEVVIHAAGVTKALSAAHYYAGNRDATANLVRACLDAAAPPERFVLVSSLAAVGPSADGALLDEDADPHPVSDYGRSKLEAEAVVRTSALAGCSVIVRPPVVYGPRDTDVYQVFRAAARGAFFRVGRREAYFSAIYATDLADGIVRAAESTRAGGRAYFLTYPEPAAWSEFAALAGAVLGRRVRRVTVPYRLAWLAGLAAETGARLRGKPGIISRAKIAEARHRYWICGHTRAAEELGFRAPTSLAEGVARTIAWYREAGWLTH